MDDPAIGLNRRTFLQGLGAKSAVSLAVLGQIAGASSVGAGVAGFAVRANKKKEPWEINSIDEMVQDFASANTLELMDRYNQFYQKIILTNQSAVMEAQIYINKTAAYYEEGKSKIDRKYINKNEWKPSIDESLYRSHHHRLKAIPYLVACHQYQFAPEYQITNSLIDTINEGLALSDSSAQEIICQNLISSMNAGAHFRRKCFNSGLIAQNRSALNTIEKIITINIDNPKHYTPMNSIAISLLNNRKICHELGDKDTSNRINDMLVPFRRPVDRHLLHIQEIVRIWDADKPTPILVNRFGTNMAALSCQPTEAILGWRKLVEKGVSKKYLAWLAVERCRHLYKSFVAGKIGSVPSDPKGTYQLQAWKILGVLRSFGVFKDLVDPEIGQGTFNSLKANDPHFYRFLAKDLAQIIRDRNHYASENYTDQQITQMSDAPFASSKSTNFLCNYSKEEAQSFFLWLMNDSDRKSITEGAIAFLIATITKEAASQGVSKIKQAEIADKIMKDNIQTIRENSDLMVSSMKIERNETNDDIRCDIKP